MNRPALALVALAGAALLGAGAAPGVLPAPEAQRSLGAVRAFADPSSATLACPPGVLDPFDPSARSAPASIWSSTGFGPGDAAPESLTVTASEGSGLAAPTALVLAGQGGGDLLGLSATPCAVPASDQWIVLGPTTLGNDAVLVLANPSSTPVEATIEAYGASGPLSGGAQRTTVPARSRALLLPAGWFADEERLVLHVRADGAGVAAFAQMSSMSGETPKGTTWTSASAPGTALTLVGVGGEDSAVLDIAVPGKTPAKVRVSLLTAQGVAPLPGGEVEVDPGTVLSVPLDGASSAPAALVLASDVPIVADVERSWNGESLSGTGEKWRTTSTIAPSLAFTESDVPGAKTLAALIAERLSAAPLRATSIQTSSGAKDPSAKILLALPGDSPAPSATVTIDGEPVEVGAGTSVLVDVPQEDSRLVSDAPVHASILVRATTPNGVVHATWPVGGAGLAARDALVSVLP